MNEALGSTAPQSGSEHVLRAAINVANPALAQVKDDGSLGGLSVALARAFAESMGQDISLLSYSTAGEVLKDEGAWDIAFLAIDPVRAQRFHFSPPYMTIEAGYLVENRSPLGSLDDVDQKGIRIATSAGAAYDLHLERTLRRAERVAYPSPTAALNNFAADGLDCAAGVTRALGIFMAGRPGYRMLPGSFMKIEQAMATPIGRVEHARKLDEFISFAVQSGAVEVLREKIEA